MLIISRVQWTRLGLFIPALLLIGCQSIGPRILPLDRYAYNQTMGRSNIQEYLLNIVRLRYDESTMSMKVNNISGSVNYQRNASILGDIKLPPVLKALSAPPTDSLSTGGSVSYADNPIISFTPMDDQTFIQAYLKILTLPEVSLLLQSSSWSIPRVMRVGFQQIGEAHNAPSAARPTSSHVPKYQNFINMTYVLRRLQLEEGARVFYRQINRIDELVVDIKPNYQFTAKEKAILKKAKVEIYNHQIIFANQPVPHRTLVVTRSMFGILNYLSKGVDVPEADLKKRVVTQTRYANGALFDWQKVLRGMIKIYSSDTPPKDAYVSIYYRKHWFYIKDSDINTKQTFVLLSNLSGLILNAPMGNNYEPTLTRTVGK